MDNIPAPADDPQGQVSPAGQQIAQAASKLAPQDLDALFRGISPDALEVMEKIPDLSDFAEFVESKGQNGGDNPDAQNGPAGKPGVAIVIGVGKARDPRSDVARAAAQHGIGYSETMAVDWEAIEREYRAGQLSVSEIGRQFSVSHTAINKRAKKYLWTRNLAERVRREVSDRLVSAEVSETNAELAVDAAAARAVEIVREHRKDIGEGRALVSMLFAELRSTNENLDEIEGAIIEETAGDGNTQRSNLMRKAISLPSRAGVIRDLSGALKNLIGIERQAFNLDATPEETVGGIHSLLKEIDGRSRGLPGGS